MAEATKPKLRQRAKGKVKDQTIGFVDFIRDQGIVGIAIGFVIGTQARILVDQLSASFINPILGLIVGTGGGLTAQQISLTIGGNTAKLDWGAFVFSLINFIAIAAIIYFTFRWLRLDKLDKKKEK